ncbi:hypothetical protein HNR46_002886 [Haloferula luteola]|uniref:Uncharacterized protein n=1 Tax=Haloferula luteola TaxID=595692 RepID=A0A840VDD1_9BACT|nr:hypothetical protein [Haloferula luteola]MBB5352638.1 hypothetical protein [Haloferula luteola]
MSFFRARPPSWKFIASFLLIIGIVLTLALGTNLVVDPWRLLATPFHSKSLDPYRDISSQTRTGKCGFVRSAPHIGIALLGSSRVMLALDPELPDWGRDDVYNLGASASFFYENEAMFRYLVAHQNPETIVLGIDPGDLSSDLDSRPMGDYYASPLGDAKTRIDRELRYHIGVSSLEESIQTLIRAARDTPPKFSPRGFRLKDKSKAKAKTRSSQRAFLAEAFRTQAAFGFVTKDRIANPIREDKGRLLRGIIDTCHEKDIRLILLLHPQHVLPYADLTPPTQPPLSLEREGIVEIVASSDAAHPDKPPTVVWDFRDAHPLNCDPIPPDAESRMPHWADFEHYSSSMGHLMLARIFDWNLPIPEGENYGIRLTSENLASWTQHCVDGYTRYIEGAGHDDILWKISVIEKARKPD